LQQVIALHILLWQECSSSCNKWALGFMMTLLVLLWVFLALYCP